MADICKSDKIVFFINPISGGRRKSFAINQIERFFSKSNFSYEIVYTRFPGDAHQQVKEKLTKGIKYFVAVGGDGTVNEVASAIVDTDAVLGIIPVGSGNGLARHLKIPLNPKKALQLIIRGNFMRMDYGKINDRLFFCTSGVGFDAHIGHIFATTKSRGFANYVKATVSEFIKYKPKKYEISFNKKTLFREAFLITVANASQYGNNAHIAPKALVNDGQMEVSIMRQFPIRSAPFLGARLFLKNIHKSNYVETYSCDEIIIRRKNSDVIHFDGEPGHMGEELKIKIIPQGLNVFVN